MEKCLICNKKYTKKLFCEDCLGKNREKTFEKRISIVLKLDKQKKKIRDDTENE